MATQTRAADGYHHGDLRRALLDAAMEVVDERGVEGLTLREVARRAGVSHNAPYHHFRDKAAIVAALAEEGYATLRAELEASLDPVAPPPAQLQALGRAYVCFALAHPARFVLMNRPELRSPDEMTAVQRAGVASEQPLFDVLARGQADGTFASGDLDVMAMGAWAMVHGLATLLVDGPLRDLTPSGPARDAMVEGALDQIVWGIAAR